MDDTFENHEERKEHDADASREDIVAISFIADGMTCGSCEKIIRKAAFRVNGVKSVDIDYATQKGRVEFDRNVASPEEIIDEIESKGYECKAPGSQASHGILNKYIKPAALTLGLIVILFGGYQFADGFLGGGIMPEFNGSVSLILLFTVGLLTGFHCIGMCGGFVVSYSARSAEEGGGKPNGRFSNIGSHLQYGAGKMLSYTAIGALFGLIGSIFVFTPAIRGLAAIFAGAFLVLFGIKMLNIFPALRRVRFPNIGLFRKLSIGGNGKRGPMKVGLLNGLMIACGPLQALYIYAAGTGSVALGAMALFAFGLGTLPILFGFGMFASLVSKSMTHKILKVSGIIVLVLGVVMLNRGLALTGTGYDMNSIMASFSLAPGVLASGGLTGSAIQLTSDGYQEIRMEVNRYGWSPDKFLLKKGVPVRWVIDGKEINGCNNAIQVPKLGLEFNIKPGEQVIEFTPTEEGVIPWSCWMGMIPGTFIVKDDIDLSDSEQVQAELDAVEVPQAGSCGGSTGGGCGCGG